ncbi:MAG: hypothetical protein ACE366_22970 [Bradymonadia bacterium]
MWRSRSKWLACALALTFSGCALDDGEPWGQAEVELEARFAPSEGRLESGRLKTTTNYAVQVDALEIRFNALAIAMGAEGSTAGFDPANPPPQYSLCHNGHCHHEDGRLVDYEDIALELAESGGGGPVITQAFAQVPVALSVEPTSISLGDCASDCQLPRGGLATATLTIGQVRISAVIFDRLTEDAQRLPDEGVAVDFTVDVVMNFPVSISGDVGKNEAVRVGLSSNFEVPETLFDGIDWQGLLDGEGAIIDETALDAQIQRNLEADGAFTVQVVR